ncbi:tRNA lysidine(34) synthetase TilS [Corynebacterium sp. H128]|uniref:tRNA lysidine(34) synthetase TilS n=1 Tax=unclassified Corynebacterium TaxID=2624378 RepID=UPI00309A4E2D
MRTAVRPFVRPEQCVLGLSGGADSLGLLAAALVEGQQVHAVCVDHGLQAGSDAVAAMAARIARSWGATAEVIAVDVPGGEGMEAAAREIRYQALTKSRQPVWVAHTMDDQAETYLLAALRGNPAGMLPESSMHGVPLLRPLLSVRRADTLACCAELGVQPWQDPHNDDLGFRRVAIRKKTIPDLGELIGGDAVAPLAQAATRAAQQASYFAEVPAESDVDKLLHMHPAQRQAALAALIRQEGGVVSSAVVQQVERLLTQWHGQGPVAIGANKGQRVWLGRSGRQLGRNLGA